MGHCNFFVTTNRQMLNNFYFSVQFDPEEFRAAMEQESVNALKHFFSQPDKDAKLAQGIHLDDLVDRMTNKLIPCTQMNLNDRYECLERVRATQKEMNELNNPDKDFELLQLGQKILLNNRDIAFDSANTKLIELDPELPFSGQSYFPLNVAIQDSKRTRMPRFTDGLAEI